MQPSPGSCSCFNFALRPQKPSGLLGTVSLCSSGAISVLLWSSEVVEEDTVLRRNGRGHGPQKEWKRTLSSEGVEEDMVLVLFLVQSLCSSGSQRSGRGQGVGSVPGSVSVLLWYSKGVEDDTVLVLFLVQSLCSPGPQKEWKRTRC